MGIILNWSTGYNGTPASVDDTVSNFPTVTDGVHDVMASHVNALAAAVIQLETIQSTLSPLTTQDEGVTLTTGTTLLNFTGAGVSATNLGTVVTINVPGFSGSSSRIEDGDGDTFVDTDLVGGDSDVVTITAPNGIEAVAPTFTGTATPIFRFAASEILQIRSGGGIPAPVDTNGSNINITANDGGDEDSGTPGVGGSIYISAGTGGAGGSALGAPGSVGISAGNGGADTGSSGTPSTGGFVLIQAGNASDATLSGASTAPGGTVTIYGGTGSPTEVVVPGTGGAVALIGGTGGAGGESADGGNGGNVTILGGAPGISNWGYTGSGGNILLTAGSAQLEGNGGSISITAGDAGPDGAVNGAGTAGAVTLQGGTGAPAAVAAPGTVGGTVSIIGGTGGAGAGSAPPGFGGVVNIRGGDAGNVLSAGAPDGGNVSIQGGYGEGFSGLGGTIQIDGGDANGGAGNYGNVQIGALETTQNISALAQTDITFQANGNVAPIPFNDTVDTDLVGFTSTSIIGALNELKASGGSAPEFTVNANTTIAIGELCTVNGSGTADLTDADSGDQFVAGIAVTNATSPNPVTIQTSGLVTGLSGLTAGARYYASTTAGAITSTPPVGSGDLVIEIGFAVSSTSLLLRIQEGYVIP